MTSTETFPVVLFGCNPAILGVLTYFRSNPHSPDVRHDGNSSRRGVDNPGNLDGRGYELKVSSLGVIPN